MSKHQLDRIEEKLDMLIGMTCGSITQPQPPSSGGDPYFANVVSLLHFDGNFTDQKGTVWNAHTANLNASIKKFGTHSMYCDGPSSGDYLTPNSNTNDFAFGTGDFTIEGWVYPTISTSDRLLYDARPQGVNGAYVTLTQTNGNLCLYVDSVTRITGGALTRDQWSHIALSRSAGVSRLFVNGVQTGANFTDGYNYLGATDRPCIGGVGADENGFNMWNGYIDEFRVTKGVARYTANFTPPTAAFPDA